MAGYKKPRMSKAEREARRRAWRETSEYRDCRRFGTLGAASDVRMIDPKTGRCVGTIPSRMKEMVPR